MKKYVYYIVLFIFLMGIGIVFVNLYSKKTFKNNNDNILLSDNKTIDNEKEDKEEENEIKEKSENNTDTTSSISNDNITNSNVADGTNNSINDNTSSKVVESKNSSDISVNNSENTTPNTDVNDNNIEIVLDTNDTNVSLNSVVSENTDIVLSINEDTTSSDKVAEVKEDNTSSSSNLTDEFVIVVNEEEVKQEEPKLIEDTTIKSNTEEVKTSVDNDTNTSNSSSNNLSNLENAKSYKKIKILKNLTSTDLVKKVTVSGKDSIGIAQSFCIAGDNYITAQINSSNTKTLIQVYDKNTGKRKNSVVSNFYHANGMTYNEEENNIYLVHSKDKKYSVFSNNNIENIKTLKSTTKKFSRAISGISYDKNTDQYYTASGYYVYVYDNNFKLIRTIKKLRKETSQDIGGYKGIIFVIVYQPNNSTANNAIDLYRASDGSYLGSYNLKFPGMELESIDYDDTNNKVSLYFNKSGSTDYIYTTNKIDIK